MAANNVDPGSTGPAYARIADELRARIAEQPPHTALPSEREIADEFHVSRMTARQAVSVLESEGSVYRRPPRGTFVAEPRVRFQVGSFTKQVERLGRNPHALVLEAFRSRATRAEATALGIALGRPVHVLSRLRLADTEPLAIEHTVIPAGLTPGLLEHPLDGSIWALMRDSYDLVPTNASAVLESRSLDQEASRLLGVRVGAPGMVLTRHTTDVRGRCIEFARDTYRADRTAFEFSAAL